jgi:hypothetical protein
LRPVVAPGFGGGRKAGGGQNNPSKASHAQESSAGNCGGEYFFAGCAEQMGRIGIMERIGRI